MAVVVDDTSTVWNDHEENLLAVERYVWFPSSRRQFGLRGKSLLELNRCGRRPCYLYVKSFQETRQQYREVAGGAGTPWHSACMGWAGLVWGALALEFNLHLPVRI